MGTNPPIPSAAVTTIRPFAQSADKLSEISSFRHNMEANQRRAAAAEIFLHRLIEYSAEVPTSFAALRRSTTS